MLDWLEAAVKMPIEDEVFVPIIDTNYASMKRIFLAVQTRYAEIDPVAADQLFCRAQTSGDKKYFVICKKAAIPPVAFIREGKTGKVVPIFPVDEDRRRQIRLMQEDGLSFEEMKEFLTDLRLEDL